MEKLQPGDLCRIVPVGDPGLDWIFTHLTGLTVVLLEQVDVPLPYPPYWRHVGIRHFGIEFSSHLALEKIPPSELHDDITQHHEVTI